VGSNEQYDFEQALGAALHTKPFTFDPFLSANASHRMHALPFLHFNQIAIAGAASLEKFREQNPGITFMTLKGAMEKLGHEYVDVLKMDCEGCEEEFIMGLKRETEEFVERRRKEGGAWTEEELEGKRRGRGDAKLVINGGNLLFGQLLVEFHAMHKPQQSLAYLYAMEGMGYRMFHVEPNPLCYPCIEVAFVHEDLVVPPLSLDCAGVLSRSTCLRWSYVPIVSSDLNQHQSGWGGDSSGGGSGGGDLGHDDDDGRRGSWGDGEGGGEVEGGGERGGERGGEGECGGEGRGEGGGEQEGEGGEGVEGEEGSSSSTGSSGGGDGGGDDSGGVGETTTNSSLLCYPCIEVAFVHEDLVTMLPGGCVEWEEGVAAAVLAMAAAAVKLAAAAIVV
ncbi:unnamed protein product, partial [Closterium sp. NIES-53]